MKLAPDFAIWVLVSQGNARRVMAAIEDFGFGSLELTEADFTSPDRVVQLGFLPCSIDVLTGIDGVSFDEAWPDRVKIDTPDGVINVIGRAHLARNKRATGRLHDLANPERHGEHPAGDYAGDYTIVARQASGDGGEWGLLQGRPIMGLT